MIYSFIKIGSYNICILGFGSCSTNKKTLLKKIIFLGILKIQNWKFYRERIITTALFMLEKCNELTMQKS